MVVSDQIQMRNGQKFAKRVLDIKYGARKWKKGAGNEYSKIVKWCQRSLRNR